MNTLRLVTISFSHYCEKARWGLQRAGVRFTEEGHLPVFHMLPVRRAGGRRTVPVLATPDGVLNDSTDILKWANEKAPKERGLYGDSDEERRDIEALEDLFDNDLGPHTRRWAYFHVLPQSELLLDMAKEGAPRWEHHALRYTLPAIRPLMRKAMRITPKGARRSQDRIDAVFAKVEEKLADGRPFLVGARLSAADITFASLAAPVILPLRYGARLPRLDRLPPVAATKIRAWQEHPAGQFVERLYRAHR